MAKEQDQVFPAEMVPDRTGISPLRRMRWRVAGVLLLILTAIAVGCVWIARKDIAGDFIAKELDSLGLKARYEIVSIGPSEQVIRNLVVGDPRRPDLTVAEIRVATRLYWGLPGIGEIRLVRPRLFGSFQGGRLSFGTLDKALFSEKGGPFEMPNLDMAIVDGRALLDSDLGRLALRLNGEGSLSDGFRGELAAVAPRIAYQDCTADAVTVYGAVATESQRLSFDGPLRLRRMSCLNTDAAVVGAAARLQLTLDKGLDGGEGSIGFSAGKSRLAANRLEGGAGKVDFVYRKASLNARYKVSGHNVSALQLRIANLAFEGRARSAQGLSRFDIEGDLTGKGVAPGSSTAQMLTNASNAGQGTFVAPLMSQLRAGVIREARGSSLTANLILRRSADGISVVVPHGALRGGSGSSLLALTRVQAMLNAGKFPRVTGNFATGGRGLPQISGRMESVNGRVELRVGMPEYAAGSTRIALPQLAMTQAVNGALSFAGEVRLTGDLPGGRAERLTIPLQGRWAENGVLSAWSKCTQVAFVKLQFANLSLDQRQLTVCPAGGRAIFRLDGDDVQIAAGIPSLGVTGRLGETPIRIASGPVGYAQRGNSPGALSARDVAVDLGPASGTSQFKVARIDARVSKDVSGAFDDADISLFAVPLDLRRTAGLWRYQDGAFSIGDASFVLVDRQKDARFLPMQAREARLRLVDNVITAQADIREPTSDRKVVRADILHDLSDGSGHADLKIDGLAFDDRLQAGMLSALAVGVVSDLRGEVRGTGRIDWNSRDVASRGRLSTQGVDFAAPFGPVKGLSGQVVFTDLLGFVTAPDQVLRVASINPGIEVTDGELSFETKPGYVLQLNGARWPFMQGTLELDPASMRIGSDETLRYKLTVRGLDAATFVQHLEMSNLTASGVFDGELPLVFDEDGGRIENGYLNSRAPGGNLSYIGELTYKDLSAMGNFAFDALKSVNYRSMQIGLGGSLTGDIVTRVSFDGLSQGTGASRNFLTKQIAKLPIRFVLNIKAPFFSLFGSVRSLYDPSYITDPRTLGLLSAQGTAATAASRVTIQPSVSENKP